MKKRPSFLTADSRSKSSSARDLNQPRLSLPAQSPGTSQAPSLSHDRSTGSLAGSASSSKLLSSDAGGGGGGNIKVVCRFRPLNARELALPSADAPMKFLDNKSLKIKVSSEGQQQTFNFDRIFDMSAQ